MSDKCDSSSEYSSGKDPLDLVKGFYIHRILFLILVIMDSVFTVLASASSLLVLHVFAFLFFVIYKKWCLYIYLIYRCIICFLCSLGAYEVIADYRSLHFQYQIVLFAWCLFLLNVVYTAYIVSIVKRIGKLQKYYSSKQLREEMRMILK